MLIFPFHATIIRGAQDTQSEMKMKIYGANVYAKMYSRLIKKPNNIVYQEEFENNPIYLKKLTNALINYPKK